MCLQDPSCKLGSVNNVRRNTINETKATTPAIAPMIIIQRASSFKWTGGGELPTQMV